MTRVMLLAGLLTAVAAWGADAARAAALEKLKREFPAHVAGPVTPKSDPAIQACWNKHRGIVQGMTLDNLAGQINQLRVEVDRDLALTPVDMERAGTQSSVRHAMQQNIIWLRQKVVPYLRRLEQFQRGR
jgi:glutamate racemase